MAKKNSKPQKIMGFVFNIKVHSATRHGEQILYSLFQKIHKDKLRFPISGDREMAIRTFFKSEVNNIPIAYGKLVSAIDLGDGDWLNLDKMEDEKYDVPRNLRAKPKEARYILVPSAHRVFIQTGSENKISIHHCRYFLENALTEVLRKEEEVEVIIQTDSDVIDRIFEASAVESLTIAISRSNNDTNKDAEKWFEDQLDEMHASRFDAKITAPKNKEGLNLENKFLKGAINLAPQNGKVDAKIIDAEGKTEIIKTEDHPKKYSISVEDKENPIQDVAKRILSLFRPRK